MADVACIVLAAGAGRRFGAPKQLALLHGRPLLQHVVDAAPDPVIVVLGAHADQVRRGIDLRRAEVVVCERWHEGQAASLRAGIAATAAVDAAVVLLGDMPFVTPRVIAGALERLTPGTDGVRTHYGGRPGHPVVLGRRLLDAARELRGDTGARELLADPRFRVRTWEAGHLGDPIDVDTQEQLEVAAR